MYKKNVSKVVSHFYNGNIDEVKFIEVDGAKFEADEKGQVKVGADGKPIPFVEKKADDIDKDKIDVATADLETLAKINPAIAAMLDGKKKADDLLTQKEKDEKLAEEKALQEKGEWQKLAEARATDLEKALDLVKQKDDLLGKYKGSVETILKDIMATIPKDNLVLIPADYSPRQKLEYITQNAKLLGAKINQIKKGDGVDNSDDTPSGTEEEKLVTEIEELIKKGDKKTKTELDILYEKSKKLTELRTKRMKEEEKNN